MQRGDIVNVLDHHEAEPRTAIVTGLPAEGLVNLYVFPMRRNDTLGVLVDVVAVDDEDAARVEGAGEHSVFVAYPLTAAAEVDDDDEDQAEEDEPEPEPAPAPKPAAAAKKAAPAAKKAAPAAKKTTAAASS